MCCVPQLRPLELTDLLWACDRATGDRLPVRRDDVLSRFADTGQRRAARIAGTLPSDGALLDEGAVDELLLRVHAELQRLGEELQLPRRLAEALLRWALPLLERQPDVPVRVVDVGCGLGYVIRWLSAHHALPPTVELVGVDLNSTLVQ